MKIFMARIVDHPFMVAFFVRPRHARQVLILWMAAGLWLTMFLPAQAQPGGSPVRLEIDLSDPTVWSRTPYAYERHTNGAAIDMSRGWPRFVIQPVDGRASCIWYSGTLSQTVNIKQRYPILVMKYRAVNIENQSRRSVLSLNEGDKPGDNIRFEPVKVHEINSDGKEHELRLDLRKVRRGWPRNDDMYQIGIAVRGNALGVAEFELISLAFESAPDSDLPAEPAPSQEAAIGIRVVDIHGKPVPQATVKINAIRKPLKQIATTDAQGQASIQPWKNAKETYAVEASAPGMTTAGVSGIKAGGGATIVLEKAHEVSGVAVDEQGKPVAGAIIQFMWDGRELPDNVWLAWPQPVITDEQGRWSQQGFPGTAGRIRIALWHQQYIRPVPAHGSMTHDFSVTHTLGRGPVTLVVRAGWSITGKVVDAQGQPIEGARVYPDLQQFPSSRRPPVPSDAQGVYRLSQLVDEKVTMTIVAVGHAPAQAVVDKPSGPSQEVTRNMRLPKGNVIRFEVVDQQGKPLKDVNITTESWREFSGNVFAMKTDAQGKAAWEGAPEEPLRYYFRRGRQSVGETFNADGQTRRIVMANPLKVTGVVTDAVTGLPVSKFVVMSAQRDELDRQEPSLFVHHSWGRERRVDNRQGRYDYTIEQMAPRRFVRITAPGYAPAYSQVFTPNDQQMTFDVKLTPVTSLEGLVLTPDGQPAANAVIFGVNDGEYLWVENGEINHFTAGFRAETDAQGRFMLPPEIDVRKIILLGVKHDQGYIELRGNRIEGGLNKITLRPWAVVTGRAMRGSRPDAYSDVRAYQIYYPQDPTNPATGFGKRDIRWQVKTRADEQGYFKLQMPEGGYEIGRHVEFAPRAWRLNHQRHILLKPGEERKDLRLGGHGRSFTATIDWSGQPPAWKLYRAYLEPIDPQARTGQPTYPDELAELGVQSHTHFHDLVVGVDQDQVITSHDVPPGKYRLQIIFYPQYWPEPGDPVGSVHATIHIPPVAAGQEDVVIDLKNIKANAENVQEQETILIPPASRPPGPPRPPR